MTPTASPALSGSYAHPGAKARVFLPAETVLDRFATLTGAPITELTGRAQTREITRLRHEAIWVLRRLTTVSLAQIGRLMGGRNMATIDEALDLVALRSARDAHYRDYLGGLVDRIATADARNADEATLKAMLRGVLSDPALADADARRAALALLSGGAHA